MDLFDAAVKGNTNLLLRLIQKDPFILHRHVPLSTSSSSSYSTTLTTAGASSNSNSILPLHLACKFGHLQFAFMLLSLHPDLSETVDLSDQSSIPLHLACRNGHLELVKCLVLVNPGACFVRDSQGRNPLHVAAIRGHFHILDELIRAGGASLAAAMERMVRPGQSSGLGGDTIFHLCVRHNRLEALKLLVNLTEVAPILNCRDGDGNTIVDLALTCGQHEAIEFLLTDKRTRNFLHPDDLIKINKSSDPNGMFVNAYYNMKGGETGSCIESRNNALLVVASLIATVAFQAGINPPGGVWSDYPTVPPDTNPYSDHLPAPAPAPQSPSPPRVAVVLGTSIMSHSQSTSYHLFSLLNTLSLLFAVTSILTLIGCTSRRRIAVIYIAWAMRLALVSITVAFYVSLSAISPKTEGLPGNMIFTGLFALAWTFGTAYLSLQSASLKYDIIRRAKRKLVLLRTNHSTTSTAV